LRYKKFLYFLSKSKKYQVITPEGSIRESSFRCRVWPSTDRPRFNELIKVLLPDQEAKNLHLQVKTHL